MREKPKALTMAITLISRGQRHIYWFGLLAAVLAATTTGGAQTYSVLYSFQCEPDGSAPTGTLTIDQAGALYGTTDGGGTHGFGSVFELSANGIETVAHSFAGPPGDGQFPEYTSVVLDAAGNLYGVTPFGGLYDFGTAYKLAADGTETILHNFTSKGGQNPDGGEPYGGLVRDQAGSLYGTTSQGGVNQKGTIFKVTPNGTESLLYSFVAVPGDPQKPFGGLVRDGKGNFYGTTYAGGKHNDGTIFEFSKAGQESVLLSLANGEQGKNPYFGVLRSPGGNLYLTVPYGGASGFGTVSGVSAAGKPTILHTFTGAPDGGEPYGVPVSDSAGNLFGTTIYGGSGTCNQDGILGCGVIFEVTPKGKESVLYSFVGPPADGEYPLGGVTIDSSGNLYGTTSSGGTYGCGTVFKYTP